ncbi:hypothetical protein KKC94_00420 [Patescibacteria group bacterium]|nr:hypothetical protein [Patescibacteria group bacterium]
MKKFLVKVGRLLIVVTVGFLFSLMIQSVWAVEGPGTSCSPPATNCIYNRYFDSLKVGSTVNTGLNSLKVEDKLRVIGPLFVSDVRPNNNTSIVFHSDIEASSFGRYYYREAECSNDGCNYTVSDGDTSKSGMARLVSSCDVGDIMLGCSGYILHWDSNIATDFLGSDIYTSNGQYRCQVLSDNDTQPLGLHVKAFCFSPD